MKSDGSFGFDSGRAFEILVIDDNSPDGTQDVVKKLQDSFGSECIVRHFIE